MMNHSKRNGLWAVTAVLLICGFASQAKAQVTYASIVGNVRDSSGAAMPNVAVTITNQATGDQFKQPTNPVGAYAFTTLFPGIYKIHAEMKGFQSIGIENIQIQVTQTARYDLTMQVGAITQTVEVNASAPVLATDKADIGNVVTNTQVQNLPLNGRNYMQLASLTNGVILGAWSNWSVEGGGPNIISEGGRITQNSFLVDGVETRTQREGGYGLNLSVDAIDEFKLMQNSFDAQYGRGTAIVNAVIKSGGNAFHGTAFEFVRNDKLDARNAFDLTGVKAPLRMNQFGGSIGGPIKKNKAFFFFDYEGQRVRNGVTLYSNVPTDAMKQGNFAGLGTVTDPVTGQPFLNNQIPSDRFVTFAKAAMPYYPAPNSTVLPNLNYQAVKSYPTTMNQYITRLDYDLSPKDRISGHLVFFRYQWINNLWGGPLPYNGFSGHSFVMPNLAGQWTHQFSPTLLNAFQFGYSHDNTFTGYDKIASSDLTQQFGLKNLSPEPDAYGVPNVGITGFGSIGSQAWVPNGALDEARQFSDQLTYVKGRHTMGFGADLRFLTYNDLGYATQVGYYNFFGAYTGVPFGDFLLGIPQDAFADQKSAKTFSLPTSNGEFSFYGQDSIRATRSLTINVGLRWEIVQFPKEVNNEFASWNFQRGALDFAGKQLPERVVPTQHTNFGPRLGLAYTPPFLKKTVFRAGSAIMYGNFRQWEVALLHFNAPYIFDNFQWNNYPQYNFTTDSLWPAVNADLSTIDFRNITVNYQNPDKRVPVTYEWNANVQHELMPNLLLEVGYVGNRGIYQPNRYDANQASFVPLDELANPPSIQSRRPYQNVGFMSGNESDAWTSYNALNVRLERRFSNGFELLGVYTYSKTMGIWQHDNFTVPDAYHMKQFYGPVNDYPHVATISYIYTLPFGPGKKFLGDTRGVVGRLVSGWAINGITSFYSGVAMDFSTGVSDLLGNRGGNVPIRVANGNLPSGQRTARKWFDTSAFIDPPTGVLGNTTPGAVWGPGSQNWDLSLFKNTQISEHKTLQFRCEMFNSFNHVNLASPDTNSSDPTFGQIAGAAAAREIQLGLKFLF
jgi:hypothetical protein